MKINVTLQVEVDPDGWYTAYGLSRKPSEVRKDVRDYIYNAVCGLPGIDESEAKVTLKDESQPASPAISKTLDNIAVSEPAYFGYMIRLLSDGDLHQLSTHP